MPELTTAALLWLLLLVVVVVVVVVLVLVVVVIVAVAAAAVLAAAAMPVCPRRRCLRAYAVRRVVHRRHLVLRPLRALSPTGPTQLRRPQSLLRPLRRRLPLLVVVVLPPI